MPHHAHVKIAGRVGDIFFHRFVVELDGGSNKPKQFEVLARKGRTLFECHVELDGHIRKQRPVDAHDLKWASELEAAA